LSDEYTNLKEEDRIGLLHEGSGPKVMNAFVEIIFDNSDGRLPIDKDEVAIKRAIGLKKDQYFLDKKVVTKSDIMNFLETAGFSRNNPYYIVKQGKINEISIAKDSFRLKILKEVAGSNVYDEKREESKNILKETEEKRQNILDVLKAIEDRLVQLEVEKEELKEFQKWDKMKRSIEYTIHNKELEHTQNKLNELQKTRTESALKSTEMYEKVNEVSEMIKVYQKEIKEIKAKEQILKDEYEQVNNERSDYISRKTRYELDLNDAIDDNRNSESLCKNADKELKQVNKLIVNCEENLKHISPQYEDIREQEEQLTRQRDLFEQERNELYAKQGRNTRFRTRDERDQWVANELDVINKALKDKHQLKGKLDAEVNDDRKCLIRYKAELESETKRSSEFQNEINQMTLEGFNINRRKDELITKRNDLWRRENALTQELTQIRDDHQKCEQNLRSITGRTILQGEQNSKNKCRAFLS
jgi:structural maintenance of chromosome 3 (chondroitin sulfate proteoglycan 6)